MSIAEAPSARTVLRLAADEWRQAEAAHASRADALTAEHRARAGRGEKHPVEDFLFTYYSYKPAILRRWHPGRDVVLADADERQTWRWYTTADEPGAARVDAAALHADKNALIRAITAILRSTSERPASFGCFGLHEWAMLYRSGEPRHDVPLRLDADGTDAVVESHELKCTHFDAFRSSPPPPSRETGWL